MTQTSLELHIPEAPIYLWRNMLRQIEAQPERLQMDWWHGVISDGDWDDATDLEDAESATKENAGCTTAHCIAGWTEVITPGGRALVKAILEIQRLRIDGDVVAHYRALGEQAMSLRTCRFVAATSPTALGAAFIIKKTWGDEFDLRQFWNLDNTSALIEIRRMARLEEERFGPLEIQAKPEPIMGWNDLPTYEGIDDPDEP